MLISYLSVRIVFIFMANELALVAQRIRLYLVEGVVETKKGHAAWSEIDTTNSS